MPHQIIEYSANLAERIDIDSLVKALHEAAIAIDALPVGGMRTRAVAREHYAIADSHPDNQFISVMLRLAPGRSPDVKRAVGETLFGALRDFLAATYDESPLSIAYEIEELAAELRWKQNNIRDYMARRKED